MSSLLSFLLWSAARIRQRNLWVLPVTLLLGCAIVLCGLPALAQAPNGITSPASGDVVSGIVIIRGSATDSSFLRYEIAFRLGNDWVVMADGDTPVIDGTLAIWDTTVGSEQARIFPDGIYELRLRVVRQDYNYDEYFVSNVRVANEGVVSTPTPTPTPEGDEGVATTRTPIPTLASESNLGLPAELPSLTPFPTPSPQATPEDVAVAPGNAGPDDAGSTTGVGLLDQLRALDYGQFGSAFWRGVRFAIAVFAALGLYLLLRAFARRLWRILRGRIPL